MLDPLAPITSGSGPGLIRNDGRSRCRRRACRHRRWRRACRRRPRRPGCWPRAGHEQVVARAADKRLVAAVAVELDRVGRRRWRRPGRSSRRPATITRWPLPDERASRPVPAGETVIVDALIVTVAPDWDDHHDLRAVAAGASVAVGRRRGRHQHPDRVRECERERRGRRPWRSRSRSGSSVQATVSVASESGSVTTAVSAIVAEP